MMQEMRDFPESAQFTSRACLLVRLSLVGLSFVACRSVSNDGGPQNPSASAPAALQDAKDGGLEVSAGFVTMNGATEVTCAFEQNENDQVQLQITVKSTCNTVGDIDVTVMTPEASVTRKMKESFTAGHPHPFRSFEFSLPPPGTLVRTQVQVTCEGNTKDKGSGRCRVPRRD